LPVPENRAVFDRTLDDIQAHVMGLGEDVILAVDKAMDSLGARDLDLAQNVVDGDAEINGQRFDIEATCLATIATQQPAAGDLRRLIADLNVVLDLERVGDYAAGIAKVCLRLPPSLQFALPQALHQMSALSLVMLREVLQAFETRDAVAARAIARQDDLMDQRYQELFDQFLGMISQPGRSPEEGLYLLFVGHNLERIADRVTNIAERVIFASSGEMRELNPEPPDVPDSE
jgi:phosphate transport system protein